MRRLLWAMLLCAPGALQAQDFADYDYENLRLAGVGIDFGVIFPTRVDPTLSLGARVDLGFLGPGVRIMPGIQYWASTLRADQFGGARLSDLILNVDGHYVWTDRVGDPYVGAGLALHFLNGSGAGISQVTEDLLDTVSPGVNLLAGAALPLGPQIRVFAEARGVLATEIRYAALSLGAILNLPRRSP